MGAGGTKRPRIHALKIRMLEPGSEIYRRSDLENLQLISILDGKFTSIQEVIAYSFSHYAKTPFLSSHFDTRTKPRTFEEIWNDVKLFGAALSGICPEKYGELTCFGLFTDNGMDWVVAELACWLYGLTVVPMDLGMSIGEVGRIVRETKMHTILCCWDTFAMISAQIRRVTEETDREKTQFPAKFDQNREDFQSLSYFVLSHSSANPDPLENCQIIPISSLISGNSAYLSSPKLSPDRERTHIAAIAYTRGTTGLRKGLYISQKQLLGVLISLQNAMPIDTTDRILSFQSLSCVFEHNLVLYAMKSGAQVHFHPQSCCFSGKMDYYESVLEAINTQLPSILRLNADFISYLLARLPTFEDTDSLKGPVSPTITPNIRMFVVDYDLPSDPNALKRLKTLLNRPILQGYGLTEAGGYVLISEAYTGTLGRVGAPAASAEVKLVPLEGGKVGRNGPVACELWYRTVTAFLGYVPLPPLEVEESVWLHTGDVFRIHKNTEFEYMSRVEQPLPTNPPQYRSRLEQRVKVCFGVENCWVRLVSSSRVVCFVQVQTQVVTKWLEQERCRQSSERKEEVPDILMPEEASTPMSVDGIVMHNDPFREEFLGNVRAEAINIYGLRSFEVPLEMYCLQHPPDADDERNADVWKQQRESYLKTLQLLKRIS